MNVIADDIARVVPSQRLSGITMNAQSASEGGGMLVDVAQPIGADAVLRLKGGRVRMGTSDWGEVTRARPSTIPASGTSRP